MIKPWIAAAMAACSLGWAASSQAADEYPSRPIHFVSIASAGGGGDAITRMLAEKMGPLMNANFVVENKPGAGGAIAAEMVARSTPDGYTILLGGFTSQVLLAAVRPTLPYDPVKDFDPIGQIGTASILLVATNDFPANSLPELIDLAKKAPDSVLYGTWGVGSTGHFCGELMSQRAGITMSHVPYKGIGPIQTDMLAGQLKLAFVDMATGTPLVKAGRLKAIASCISRSPSLPEVAGFDEQGIDFQGKSVIAPMWAVYAPAGTPPAALDKLRSALKQVVDMPDVREKLLNFGVKADFVGGDDFRQRLASGVPEWKEIARKSDIVIK